MQKSFAHLKPVWLENINTYASDNVVKLLVGTKCDLTGKREVDYITAKVSKYNNQCVVMTVYFPYTLPLTFPSSPSLPLSNQYPPFRYRLYIYLVYFFILSSCNWLIQDFADQLQIPFFEISAKDSTNIEQAFVSLAAMIRRKRLEQDSYITLGGNV